MGGIEVHIALSLHNYKLLVAVDQSSKDDLVLTQPPATKYDVFLSFRGEDTRNNFTSYLYKELHNAGIETFMDNQLLKGDQISEVLLRAIEESEISVIIFSQNYACSTWCMDELVHILECQERFGRVVIPIFHYVDPSNIRKQVGIFGNGFDKLEGKFKGNQEKLQKWRNALDKAARLSGWHLDDKSPETEVIEDIVADIWRKLSYQRPSHHKRFIGIRDHIQKIEGLLRNARIVGILGMNGVGKTTLADAVFFELKPQFEASLFIEGIREELNIISTDELLENCIKELLKDEEDISSYDINPMSVKSRLRRKKILLILDDVFDPETVDDFIEVCNCFGEGSRIIITSSNMQVLHHHCCSISIYHLSPMNSEDAFRLFCSNAFERYEPPPEYLMLSYEVVDYCRGMPLALKVVGRFLHGKTYEEWMNACNKLRRIADYASIMPVLKLGFDGLAHEQKSIFLDLTSMEEGHVSMKRLRQLYGSSVDNDIAALEDKSLISFNHNGYIVMNNLVRRMAYKISTPRIRDMYEFSTTGKNSDYGRDDWPCSKPRRSYYRPDDMFW